MVWIQKDEYDDDMINLDRVQCVMQGHNNIQFFFGYHPNKHDKDDFDREKWEFESRTEMLCAYKNIRRLLNVHNVGNPPQDSE